MAKLTLAFGLAILVFSSMVFAGATGAAESRKKMDALDTALKPYLGAGESATYDNFISREGIEYAVASINYAPSFLVAIAKEGDGYKVDFIKDNSTIRQIMEGRLSVFNFSQSTVNPKSDLHPSFVSFNSSRYLPEEKCRVLLGMGNAGCDGAAACNALCENSSVCRSYLAQNSIIPDEMARFSSEMKKMDGAVALENEIASADAGEYSQAQVAGNYTRIISTIENSTRAISNLSIAGGESVCAKITYDVSPLEIARAKVAMLGSTANLLEEKNAAIVGVQKVTSAKIKQETVIIAPKNETPEIMANQSAENTTAAPEGPAQAPSARMAAPDANAPAPQNKPALDGMALDIWRVVGVAAVILLAVGAAYFYMKKKNGQMGKGLRI